MSQEARYNFEKIDEKSFSCKITYGGSDVKFVVIKYPKPTMSEMIAKIINNFDDDCDEDDMFTEILTKDRFEITFEEGLVFNISYTMSFRIPFGDMEEKLKELLIEYS